MGNICRYSFIYFLPINVYRRCSERSVFFFSDHVPRLRISRVVNGTDNFRSESASVSVFEDMVCIFRNPPDMDADADSAQADIRRIR
jgi:hypothetical protein